MSCDGKRCEDICKHAPPQKGKWPCEDCDMRYHDRAEKMNGVVARDMLGRPLYDRPQTNSDRIRNMTDEELEQILTCPKECGYSTIGDCMRNMCRECKLDWLKQEANTKDD